MTYYTRFESPLCEIILVGDDQGLSHLHLNTGKGKRQFEISPDWIRNDVYFEDIRQQILAYAEGKQKTFKVKLNPRGTDFQKRCWKELTGIPYGMTRTYQEIATIIGNPKASRAVGNANSLNPIPLIIPCHRVVGANGSLTGFAHGLEMKQDLIDLEQGQTSF